MFYDGKDGVSDTTKKSIDMINQLFNISFDSFQKISQLQMNVSKKNVEHLLSAMKDSSKINNLEDAYDKFNKYTNDTLEQNVDNLKVIYGILDSTQDSCNKLLEDCYNNTRNNFFDMFKNMHSYPNWQNSNVVKDNLQGFMDMTNQVMKNMSDFASKSSNFAQEQYINMANGFVNTNNSEKESQNK